MQGGNERFLKKVLPLLPRQLPPIVYALDKVQVSTRLDDNRCYGAPDFIAEIVSSNKFDDYNRKLELYKLSGVREYWVIDPIERKTTVFTFEDTVNISFYPFETPVPVNIYKGELSIVIADLL